MNVLDRNKQKIYELISAFKESKVYGPSDDPDARTAMIIGHNDLVIKLKYYTRNISNYLLEKEINSLDDHLESIYDVYQLRSRIEPLLEELEEEIRISNDLGNFAKSVTKFNPKERIHLIDAIALRLRDSMSTRDINMFLEGYGIDFMIEEVAQSKRIYVKEILSKESEIIILEIAKDLDLYEDDSLVEISKMASIDSDFIKEQVSKCSDKIILKDYDGAITNARTLVESICIYILEDSDIEHKKNGKLNQLYGVTSNYLKMQPALYKSDSLKQITSGFITIIQGLSGMRNDMSDAHGKGYKSFTPEERHAKLAVNSAHTVSSYLLESYLRSKQ